MEAQRQQAHDVKEYGSDLTTLADPHWQVHRQGFAGDTRDAYGSSDYPHKRQAVAHESPAHSYTEEPCWTQSSSQLGHQQVKAGEPQCCAQPGVAQQKVERTAYEQQSSSSAEAFQPSSRRQLASRAAKQQAHEEQSHPSTSLIHHREQSPEGGVGTPPPAVKAEQESSKDEEGPKIVMEDDGGYSIPVVMTDRDICIPASSPTRAPRIKAEPDAQAGRPRRSRAAAIACQVRLLTAPAWHTSGISRMPFHLHEFCSATVFRPAHALCQPSEEICMKLLKDMQ